MTTNINQYLKDGCMRCKYGGTDKCKVNTYRTELKLLRQIVLQTNLTEEVKWGVPVYTLNGKNIVMINALKASANLGFYKGVLLKDTHNLLQQQGNVQTQRIMRFTNTDDILKLKMH